MVEHCIICGRILNYHDILELKRGCFGCLNKNEIESEKYFKDDLNG